MYTDDDLNSAIQSGIFSKDAVDKFRQQVSTSANTLLVDEENFRLISGFNDIFVVIACILLMSSTLTIFGREHLQVGFVLFTAIAWGLSEFFVRHRKLALPAIILLLAFVGGVFSFALSFFEPPTESSFAFATASSALAAYLHWTRFRVPITVAIGIAAIVGCIIVSILAILPNSKEWISFPLFICGTTSFVYALFWDMSDRSRVTRRSDVAFWLHLLAAPLIIHPVFSGLGILDGHGSLTSMVVVLGLYFLMTLISLIIDRRAFMVSSLVYVIYALSKLLEIFGNINQSFAITGVLIGSALLLLSAFWHAARMRLLMALPLAVQEKMPVIK